MTESKSGSDVVVDLGKGGWGDLLKMEDWWAVWLGFALLIVGAIIYFPSGPAGMDDKIAKANAVMQAEAQKAPFKTLAWYKANDSKKKLKATSGSQGKAIKSFTSKPKKWSGNPVNSFYRSKETADAINAKAMPKADKAKKAAAAALATAQASEQAAATAGFKNAALNDKAKADIGAYRGAKKKAGKAGKKAKAKPYSLVLNLILYGLALGAFFSIGMFFMGKSVVKFFLGFLFVYFIGVVGYFISAYAPIKASGIGYAAWAIILGLLISNTLGTPKWVMPGVQVEYYIKTGLVLLGAEILFGKIMSIGIPGIFVAWVVTPIVLLTTFWFGQKVVKMSSKTLNITIAADMSVCGVSAAIATAAACRAKKEELTLAVGMSLVFTAIMMVVMPNMILAMGMPIVMGAAWMGGTIDATGAVAAAGAFLGETGLQVAATVKLIQNVLIGVIAFFVAVYWVAKVEARAGAQVSAWEIWYRFPKFVIGFIGASIIFSLIYTSMGSDVGYTLIDQGVIRGWSKIGRGWFFNLAFVSIGLATNFRVLAKYFTGGKPLILYLCGQSLNLALTLGMVYVMFYVIFTDITAKI